ncbi:hypothetical protein [Criblamydia sequanensis]|uniref:Conserved putative secreted protein n=1 Tax=Candidatus Criblamydia sequanensis CRIB-18 TaxID=1437425 RepID=A0A090D0S2_9BACT|nr:hypothetical protein [Criblamydia sequanensis]CDR33465.1 Conserved putative secreted protein [Criblamydia sequanensis CRIB-18]
MKKHFSIKSFAIIAAISALFISSSQIQPLSGHDYIRESVISDQYEISDSDLIITIESFLQNSVPGMDATYRQVIDILIDEGQNVWISGGILRDLLGSHPDKPHDLDFSFSGNPEEIQKIADKNGWLYTFFPGSKTITIGDRNGIFMEGLPKAFSVDRKDESEEFTINTIYYNCNKSCFLPESKIGLADLKKRILRIKTNRWYDWLFSGEEKYNKIFRFWKMAGKGYFFSKELESFIANEAEKAWRKDRKLFSKQMLEYLGSHYSSFDQVETGCRLVMGETWTKAAVSKLRKKAFKKDKEIDEVWDAYTHYPLDLRSGAQAIGRLPI